MSSTPASAHDHLHVIKRLRDAVSTYTAGEMSAAGVVTTFREQASALPLPEAYPRVLEELLRRLEMADVFSQDSCSFSSTGIQEQLEMWLDKAEAYLSARAST